MLHVLTGAACNTTCLFCMEQDRAARAAHVGAQAPADIRAMLAAHEDREEVHEGSVPRPQGPSRTVQGVRTTLLFPPSSTIGSAPPVTVPPAIVRLGVPLPLPRR